jgi:hypothetical protein
MNAITPLLGSITPAKIATPTSVALNPHKPLTSRSKNRVTTDDPTRNVSSMLKRESWSWLLLLLFLRLAVIWIVALG